MVKKENNSMKQAYIMSTVILAIGLVIGLLLGLLL